jgi:hypothetical protein
VILPQTPLWKQLKTRVIIVPPEGGSIPKPVERRSNDLKGSNAVKVSNFYVIPSNSTSMRSSSFDTNVGGRKETAAFIEFGDAPTIAERGQRLRNIEAIKD